MGTENASLAKSQIAFRMNHGDDLSGEKSFIYGPSTANIVGCLIEIILYSSLSRLHDTADRGIMVTASKTDDILVDRCPS